MTLLEFCILTVIGLCGVALQVHGEMRLREYMKAKPAPRGRPRGSKNKAPDPIRAYFGPETPAKPQITDDEMDAYIKAVNSGRIVLAEDEMIDPLDEMRVGTGYAGT